jgi:hypothetical protein
VTDGGRAPEHHCRIGSGFGIRPPTSSALTRGGYPLPRSRTGAGIAGQRAVAGQGSLPTDTIGADTESVNGAALGPVRVAYRRVLSIPLCAVFDRIMGATLLQQVGRQGWVV